MAKFKKGVTRPAGAGRKKGTPNRVTQDTREAVALLIDKNLSKLQIWLDQIYKQHGPLEAFKIIMSLMEYHIPKLARTEYIPPPEPYNGPWVNLNDREQCEALTRKIIEEL